MAEQNINKKPWQLKTPQLQKKKAENAENAEIAKNESCECSTLHARHLRIHGRLQACKRQNEASAPPPEAIKLRETPGGMREKRILRSSTTAIGLQGPRPRADWPP
jgi:hypothetical protein